MLRPVRGAQVEIEASFRFAPGAKSVFGLMVFVGNAAQGGSVAEHTDIVFDLGVNQVHMDRRGCVAFEGSISTFLALGWTS